MPPLFVKLTLPLVSIFLFVVGYLITYNPPTPDSTIKIETAPEGTTVIIDNEKADTGENKVWAGKHTVTFKKDGFKEESRTLTTKSGESVYVGTALSSNSEKTKNWYTDNPNDQKLAEGISSHYFDYSTSAAHQENTLLQQLPLNLGGSGGNIRIDKGIPIGSSTQPAIYVTAATPADRRSILAWMENNGYTPATMDIVFYGMHTSFMPQGGGQ